MKLDNRKLIRLIKEEIGLPSPEEKEPADAERVEKALMSINNEEESEEVLRDLFTQIMKYPWGKKLLRLFSQEVKNKTQ